MQRAWNIGRMSQTFGIAAISPSIECAPFEWAMIEGKQFIFQFLKQKSSVDFPLSLFLWHFRRNRLFFPLSAEVGFFSFTAKDFLFSCARWRLRCLGQTLIGADSNFPSSALQCRHSSARMPLSLARCAAMVTHLDQFLADFVAYDAGIELLQVLDARLYLRRCDLRLRAANHARPYRARLLVSIQDFRHTAVRYAQLTRDLTRPDARGGHFNDFQSRVVRQRPTVDKHSAQLIHAALT